MKAPRWTYLSMVLVLASALGLAACGGGSSASENEATSPAIPTLGEINPGEATQAEATPAGVTPGEANPAETTPAGGQQPQSGVQVVMSNNSFQPAQITVPAGTTVTWINQDSTSHTVTAGTRGNPSGLFDSGEVASGGTFSFTFDTPGTYDYFCSVHNGMDGQVVVQ